MTCCDYKCNQGRNCPVRQQAQAANPVPLDSHTTNAADAFTEADLSEILWSLAAVVAGSATLGFVVGVIFQKLSG